MKKMNIQAYKSYPPIDLPDRRWPDRTITEAPVWCSVDLRDGNQALSIPMNVEEKLKMFELLVAVGFKEIEIGFPAAAKAEYDFTRMLIEENRIPDDVTTQVLTQAREHLIRKTFEALEGVKNAIVHLYNSTSTLQREVVFKKDKEAVKAIAVEGARLMQELKERSQNPGLRFQYSPESFTGTELDYALEICHAVMDVWRPTPGDRIILNLPATVEVSTPNVHADQIEWMCRNIRDRDCVIISLHTHNDRGTAGAASELALMAGAERVEGTLFGNGERTGNCDLFIMALNLFSQGVDPRLDLSDVNHIRDVYEACTRMTVHERHPYVGELVYTAFSGSHQDAINKGMKAQEKSGSTLWQVPYLPINPRDVGRTYESIIRINSQSGKGGVAYIMEREFGFILPKAMHPEFGVMIQKVADEQGDELSPRDIWQAFEQAYLIRVTPYAFKHCSIHVDMAEGSEGGEPEARVKATVDIHGREVVFEGRGNGPIDAFTHGFQEAAGIRFAVASYNEHAIAQGSDSKAVAYMGLETPEGDRAFGAGVDTNISIASIKSLVSAANRLYDLSK